MVDFEVGALGIDPEIWGKQNPPRHRHNDPRASSCATDRRAFGARTRFHGERRAGSKIWT